jgi:hypothetical protein
MRWIFVLFFFFSKSLLLLLFSFPLFFWSFLLGLCPEDVETEWMKKWRTKARKGKKKKKSDEMR